MLVVCVVALPRASAETQRRETQLWVVVEGLAASRISFGYSGIRRSIGPPDRPGGRVLARAADWNRDRPQMAIDRDASVPREVEPPSLRPHLRVSGNRGPPSLRGAVSMTVRMAFSAP
jgi:hypothetical protein